MPVTTCHDLELPACTPEPLMAYLKALGILRLVSRQKDSDARGWWKNDTFWLRSTLDRDALVSFFLKEYKPTPIVAPWAGGSGFFKKDNQQAVNALCNSSGQRCRLYADTIRQIRQILHHEKLGDKPRDEDKIRLIRRYRRELPDEVLAWMDAAMVLQHDGQAFAPLLGTGGNDGRLDFTQNFMQRILSLGLHESGQPTDQSRAWLEAALFASPAQLDTASVGQFAPGRAGGPNATQGMEGDSTDNPWDFILMLEGAILLAGAAVRRYGLDDSSRVAFPFTVRAIAAGFDSPASKDETDSRGELWLPLWPRPASIHELNQLFGEGRAEVSGRPARDGTDFARAVAGLGVDRGIAAFNRVGFLKRSGKAFLAAPLGRFEVAERSGVDLLREVDPWTECFRRAVATSAKTRDKAPPRFSSALRAIDSAIFDFCKYGGAAFFQRILIALGAAERELALTPGRVGQSLTKVPPLAGLTPDWLQTADDGLPEFAIARALAAVYDPQGRIGPLRANLEPVDWKSNCRRWLDDTNAQTKERSVVWTAADLPTNLTHVLARRLMDGARAGCDHLPLASPFAVSLHTIAAFIAGDLDDERIEQLIWGLMLVDQPGKTQRRPEERQAAHSDTPALLPRDYALLKLLFLPRPLVPERSGENVRWRLAGRLAHGRIEAGLAIRPEPRVLPLLRAGRVGEACRIAAQRLRTSGLSPMPGALPAGGMRDDTWDEGMADPRRGWRLATALLIPLSSESVNSLVKLVCRADDSAGAET